MKSILSLDGGGTKVECLVAGESGCVRGHGIGGPANSVFNTAAEISGSITDAIAQALAGERVPAFEVEAVYCAMPASSDVSGDAIRRALGRSIPIHFVSEFRMSIVAAILQEIGALSLAGTGSFATANTGRSWHRVGGYGSLLGDEGSGYDIGRRALNACARMRDGIGPATDMYEEIVEAIRRIGYSSLIDIYRLPTGQQRSFVASVSAIAGRAAARGDAPATAILHYAAEQLAEQTIGVLAKCGDEAPPGFPVTVAGGVWKAHAVLFRTFAENVKRSHSNVRIVPPLFSPVAGGVLIGLMDQGFPLDRNISQLKKNLADYLARLPE